MPPTSSRTASFRKPDAGRRGRSAGGGPPSAFGAAGRHAIAPFLILILLCAGAPLDAQRSVRIPAPGDPERRQLLDVIRPGVEREVAGRVIFSEVELRIAGDWAFIYAEPRGPSGERLEAFRARCDCDDIVYALLRRRAGDWTIVRLIVGATDVPWVTWDRDHGAPREIFPWPEAPE